MVEQIGQPGEIPDFLRKSRKGKPPANLTIFPNDNGDNIIDPEELLHSFRSLVAQTPQDVRILRRRIKRRSPL